jgi:hypothetical protein
MGSSTQVPVVRRVWAPVATSCRAKHLMPPLAEALTLVALIRYRKPLSEADGSPRMSRGGGRGGAD